MPFDVQQAKAAIWAALELALEKMRQNNPNFTGDAILDPPPMVLPRKPDFTPDILVQWGPFTQAGKDFPRGEIPIDVISKSKSTQDWTEKLEGYFSAKRIVHYVIVDLNRKVIIHHEPGGGAPITTFVRDAPLTLAPPGVTIPWRIFFGPP